MTRVLCGYADCKYYKHQYEDVGECQREEILLDDNVDSVYVGCPDAEWEEREDGDD